MIIPDSAAAVREYTATRLAEARSENAARNEAASQTRFEDRVQEGKAAVAARPRPQDQPVPIAQRLVDITV